MSAQGYVAIIDDNPDIRQMLSGALTDAGFTTQSFARAADFERSLATKTPEVCVVDLGLPDKDGLSIVAALANSATATLVISGRSTLQDKIVGLELGADDYLAKPFEIREVIARVRALLRRKTPNAAQNEAEKLTFSGWTVDFAQFTLTDAQGNITGVSASEAMLLRIFLTRPNRLITRDQLRDELNEKSDAESFDRAIDVRLSRLRAKLKDSTKDPKIIKTIYGAGYILISDVSAAKD
ncbi:MAG: response regulator transcription factor [Yoonia sp.]|jgi:DNA-binding response OmpR family regulator